MPRTLSSVARRACLSNRSASDLLLWGLVVHLIGDWLLQNDWQAKHKSDFGGDAATVHSSIHWALLALVFPPLPAQLLALSHRVIDTRKPLHWWQDHFKQTTVATGGDVGLHVAMWADQTLHIACLALAALAVGRRR